MKPEHPRLNMGSGFRKVNDYWNVDIEPRCNPDEILDLEKTPWPYEDNFFEKIMADNILEHLGQNPRIFTEIIKEMYRVSKDQAEWIINVPHHRCDNYYDDYTHVRALTPRTFMMFDQATNHETIKNNMSHSTFGLNHGVDIEVFDVNFRIINIWREQQSQGMLAPQQLQIKLNTLANVAESVDIFCRVHKPGRFTDYKF